MQEGFGLSTDVTSPLLGKMSGTIPERQMAVWE
jgi:hypothetical protein